MKTDNTRLTMRCCYGGMLVLALVVNLAPPLFIPLSSSSGLTFEQIGRLILINFATQVGLILAAGRLVDRFGAKAFAIAANALVASGLALFALAPALFADPYNGIVLGVVVFSLGRGILELILSPIMNALPSERKAQDMSLLHRSTPSGSSSSSSYGAGGLGARRRRWRWIVAAWMLLPVLTAGGFTCVTIGRLSRSLAASACATCCESRSFIGALAAIALAGATELAISQWVSAFAQKGLGFSKILGDLAGMSLFAAALARGQDMVRAHVGADNRLPRDGGRGALSVAMYLVASLSPWPAASLAGCVRGRVHGKHPLAGNDVPDGGEVSLRWCYDVRYAFRIGLPRRRCRTVGRWRRRGPRVKAGKRLLLRPARPVAAA